MDIYRLLLLCAFILLLPSGGAGAQTDGQSRKDSLQNVIDRAEGKAKLDACLMLTNLYMAEARDQLKRDTLFRLYDLMDVEAEKQGNDSIRAVIRKNRLNTLHNAQRYDDIIRLASDYMAFTEKRQLWDIHYQLYEPLVRAYRYTGDTDRAFALTEKMLEEAKARNHPAGIGLANFAMSGLYLAQRRHTEREECLRECIRFLQDSPSMIQSLENAYIHLGLCLIALNRFDDAEAVARETEPVIRRNENITGSPQPNSWINLFTVYRDLYQQSAQYDKAEMYCDKLDSVSGGTVNTYEARSFIYMNRKQYDRALEMADKAVETAVSASNRLQTMGTKMMVLIQMNEPAKTERQFRDIIIMMDSINRSQLNARLDELRTQYEVEKITAERERIRQQLYYAFGGCLLLAVILGIYVYYSRQIQVKNRGLFRKIKEQDALMETLEQIARKYEALEQSLPSAVKGDIVASMAQELPGDRQQRALVVRFHDYLLEKRRYVKAETNLEEIISALATNRSYLFEAVKTVADRTPTDYINSLRLEEAKKMLENSLELNVELIAENCGFNSRATFYRLFREFYQINPTEYRRQAQRQ